MSYQINLFCSRVTSGKQENSGMFAFMLISGTFAKKTVLTCLIIQKKHLFNQWKAAARSGIGTVFRSFRPSGLCRIPGDKIRDRPDPVADANPDG